ncbi:MAG: phosphatase PAP2 family protein [Saprospiraceae bacterium]
MKKILLVLVVQALVSNWTLSQNASPYRWRAGVDAGLALGGGTTLAIGRVLSSKMRPLTADELAAANASNIRPKFDRRAMKNWSEGNAETSDWLLRIGVAAPVGLLFSQPIRQNDLFLTGAMAAETYLLTLGLTELTKNLARRSRPYIYDLAAPLDEKMGTDARRSFFSGHTSMSAAGCFFAAKVWSDFHPSSKWRPVVWGGAAALPALTGLYRVLAGKHFPTDVLAGYAVGGFCGWLVPHLHRRERSTTDDAFLSAYSVGSASVLSFSLIF